MSASFLETTISLLVLGAVASYLGGVLFRHRERLISGVIAFLALLGSLISFSLLFRMTGASEKVLLFGVLSWQIDLLGWIVAEVSLVLGTVVALYSIIYMEEDTGTSKFFPLLLLMVLSVMGLAFAYDLFNLYLFFELLSITSFALVAFRKDKWEPVEAGIKFMVMSVTGSAFILLGISLVYAQFGNLDLNYLFTASGGASIWLPITLFLIGFGIKAAMFPLHTWLPDAHPEAPSGISAMLSGIIIQTGLFTMLRIMLSLGASLPWGEILIWFALLTMTAGNIMALTQKQLKRMLAYSSIAQMGYILLGIGMGATYGVASGFTGGVFHIITHAFMKGLAFLCAGALIFRLSSGYLEDMRGAGWKMPVTALTFSVAALSLAGVPPFSGFMSKLLIYQSGIQSGTALGWAGSLVAIFNSVLSLGYYLPAIGVLYSKEKAEKVPAIKEVPWAMTAALVILCLLTIYLGVQPDPVRSWVAQAFSLLKGGF
ncbi:MAG: proton-conducting transporter membrane subunit [Coprothermobacterota bacterium]|nr:proton-conducting transporter membrane subunit [Coprothermobacterota bacterium]